MGRPEPCILFAQTILHSQLDEYVDEVTFSQPVVVTACEFLEQNASPSTANISLVGATSPPSFALEVFVHCEGESRFRRLCQPFLYSHSSSNVLEVEAIVTSHLVLRGTYRSLTLVIYGNTAEDLGQFNIDVDLDNSLANVGGPADGDIEDFPPVLLSSKLVPEELLSLLKSLCFQPAVLNFLPEVKQFCLLILQFCQKTYKVDMISSIVGPVISAVSQYALSGNGGTLHALKQDFEHLSLTSNKESQRADALCAGRIEIFQICKGIMGDQDESNFAVQPEIMPSTEVVVDMFMSQLPLIRSNSKLEFSYSSKGNTVILELCLTLLLSSSTESCLHFLKAGGIKYILGIMRDYTSNSNATTLLILGIIEHITRHTFGCEAFLGWWPRENDTIPNQASEGYTLLVKLLLEMERHDIASLVTYILQRLRFYEILCRYECIIIFLLANMSPDKPLSPQHISMLQTANTHLMQLLKLVKTCQPIDDPSVVAIARRRFNNEHEEGMLSYKATVNFITSSECGFTRVEIDSYMLSLLKERGFLALSAALLSSPVLRSVSDSAAEMFLRIASSLESIFLALLLCHSGLCFLLSQPEVTELLVLSLQDPDSCNKVECLTLRQASVLLSKGFFCRPQEVGTIMELHVEVGRAVSRLLAASPNSDDLLLMLWELCAIARSDSGRQALLVIGYFPEAVAVLLNAVSSYKDQDSTSATGASPLSLAIYHTASAILEVLVSDSAAASVSSWIGLAVDLHKALQSSSPGTNRNDAPTRLLEWIDAAVVYHRNGAIGLLRYSAIIASSGDAHHSSTEIPASDSLDSENVVSNSNTSSDGQAIDNLLGKPISEKNFDGLTMSNTSIVQLTTAFRILAFISEDMDTAAALFEEGAISVVFVVLMNCKTMLERLANSYDYLVDEGAELSSTNDLLLDRSHEQNLVDLMIPVLLLLINILRKIRDSKEQYRNTKLVNALLKLHRELSPKLAACATDMSFMYPGFALSFGTVCHLITSALACWPLFSWLPGLFHCLLENVQATSVSLALGPKDACSLLCILGDLFPEEGVWMWQAGIPPLSAIRLLSSGAVLGPQLEREVNWYLHPEHMAILLVRLTSQLDRVALVVEKLAASDLKVTQDMLRIFVVRVASKKVECAVVILRPLFSWLEKSVEASLSELDSFKVYQMLNFLALLSEHPNTKDLFTKMDAVRILSRVLYRCCNASLSDGKLMSGDKGSFRRDLLYSWKIPIFKWLFFYFGTRRSLISQNIDELFLDPYSTEICSILCCLLKFLQVLPVGHELLACALAFKELASSFICQSICSLIVQKINSTEDQEHDWNDADVKSWKQKPPLLTCWIRLMKFLGANNYSGHYVAETIFSLTLGSICFIKSNVNSESPMVLRLLYGLTDDLDTISSPSENLAEVFSAIRIFECKIELGDDSFATTMGRSMLFQLKESLKSFGSYLQNDPSKSGSIMPEEFFEFPSSTIHSIYMTSLLIPSSLAGLTIDGAATFFTNLWKCIGDEEKQDFSNSEFEDRFIWELSNSSFDKQLNGQSRRKAAAETSGRRMRENQPDGAGQNSRGLVMANPSSVPTRRDSFRQRKPNTSRPPSLHVDEYVLRERIIDGTGNGSYVSGSGQRGPMSGRPPSIHVDEFNARERERHNPTPSMIPDIPQVNDSAHQEKINSKSEKAPQLKSDLGDDQEIDIVFDEESVSDEKLPFPQPDDVLCSPTAVIGENSPGPTIEDTNNTQNERIRFQHSASPSAKEDESFNAASAVRQPATQDSFQHNIAHPGMNRTPLTGEDGESRYPSSRPGTRVVDSQPSNRERPPQSSHSSQLPRHHSPTYSYYHKRSPQKYADSSVSFGSYAPDVIFPHSQPPLPPVPPPISSRTSKGGDSVQRNSSTHSGAPRDVPPLYSLQPFNGNISSGFSGLQFHSESMMPFGNNSTLGVLNPDSKLWNPPSGSKLSMDTGLHNNSARAMSSPLHSQYSTSPHLSAVNSGASLLFNNNVSTQPPVLINEPIGIASASGSSLSAQPQLSFPPPSLLNRPPVYTGSILNSPLPQQMTSTLSLGLANSQHSIPSMQSQPPPRPPPLPQHPHPSQSVQLPGSTIMQQLQSGQVMSYTQGSIQVPANLPQQISLPQIPVHFPSPQEHVSQVIQPLAGQAQPNIQSVPDSLPVPQNESQTSLQQYFSSPEAIQSLLSDRDKLCHLLEQHPKLMQMLQDRLGQP